MTDHTLEQQEVAASQPGAARLVPVGESIKYRRRAQQAETKLQETEQMLTDLQAQLSTNEVELAASISQREQAVSKLLETHNRLTAERLLTEAGAVDVEAASLLLEKRVDLSNEVDTERLRDNIDELLTAKPFLRATKASPLPPATASSRAPNETSALQLSRAAEQAVKSGNRRDVAEYLRLRRQTAGT